jgi:hypothetical protein
MWVPWEQVPTCFALVCTAPHTVCGKKLAVCCKEPMCTLGPGSRATQGPGGSGRKEVPCGPGLTVPEVKAGRWTRMYLTVYKSPCEISANTVGYYPCATQLMSHRKVYSAISPRRRDPHTPSWAVPVRMRWERKQQKGQWQKWTEELRKHKIKPGSCHISAWLLGSYIQL